MNAYGLDFTGISAPTSMDGALKSSVLKTLAYFALMGRGVKVNKKTIVDKVSTSVVTALEIVADLDFSLSNVKFPQYATHPTQQAGSDVYRSPLFSELVYDTRFQSVREWIEKPYAVKGYVAMILVANGSSLDFQKDFDQYTKMRLHTTFSKDGLDEISYLDLYIGVCNAGKTDFYTPFGDIANSSIVFYDPSQVQSSNPLLNAVSLADYVKPSSRFEKFSAVNATQRVHPDLIAYK